MAATETEIGMSFQGAADEINADFRRGLFNVRRCLHRDDVPFAVRALRDIRAAALDALRRTVAQKRRAARRLTAEKSSSQRPATKRRRPSNRSP